MCVYVCVYVCIYVYIYIYIYIYTYIGSTASRPAQGLEARERFGEVWKERRVKYAAKTAAKPAKQAGSQVSCQAGSLIIQPRFVPRSCMLMGLAQSGSYLRSPKCRQPPRIFGPTDPGMEDATQDSFALAQLAF